MDRHLGRLLDFGRRDLEKGRTGATHLFFAPGVDPGLDYLTGIQRLNDVALMRRGVSPL